MVYSARHEFNSHCLSTLEKPSKLRRGSDYGQEKEGKVFALSHSKEALIRPEGYEASVK